MNIDFYLKRSRASATFKNSVAEFLSTGLPNECILFENLPSVKVERLLTKLLDYYPEEEVMAIFVIGQSGCEYFSGLLKIDTHSGSISIRFLWDCKWKAREMGWFDYFGFPDQRRAAVELAHECFKEWTELGNL